MAKQRYKGGTALLQQHDGKCTLLRYQEWGSICEREHVQVLFRFPKYIYIYFALLFCITGRPSIKPMTFLCHY